MEHEQVSRRPSHHFTKIVSMEHSNSQTPQNKHMQRANPHLAVTYQIGNQPQNHEVKSPWSPIFQQWRLGAIKGIFP